MKKIKKYLLICITLTLLFGCTNSKKQNEILDYVNNDLVMLGEIETKMLNSYNAVSGNNYESDLKLYEELSNNTINYARELNVKASEIAQKYMSNAEILDVHTVYLNYTTNYLNAMSYILTAIETQNREMTIKANNEINSANSTSLLFRGKLNDLCDKYKIVLKYK